MLVKYCNEIHILSKTNEFNFVSHLVLDKKRLQTVTILFFCGFFVSLLW